MMKLNIPLLKDDTVTFNATLLAIVRQSLKINTSGTIIYCGHVTGRSCDCVVMWY